MALQIPAKLSLPLPSPDRCRVTIASISTSSSSSARSPLCASLAAVRSFPRQSFNGVLLSLSASLAVLLSTQTEAGIAAAATIKMGADEGSLIFVPSSISVPAGEKITFLNNKGFPHNVIFEKDGVPETVQVEKISHEDYMNEQGEQFVITLQEKGTYRFFCEPHRAAGLVRSSVRALISSRIFGHFPSWKGGSPIIVNFMSFCIGGVAYLSRCGWGQDVAVPPRAPLNRM